MQKSSLHIKCPHNLIFCAKPFGGMTFIILLGKKASLSCGRPLEAYLSYAL